MQELKNLETINKIKLINAQNREGIKRFIQHKNRETASRGIITKDVLVPLKDKDGKVIVDKDGKPTYRVVTIPTSIPEVEKEAIKVFIETYPCWFPGCQEIRDAYNRELGEQQNKDGCTSCKKGTIMRKYLAKAVDILKTRKPENGS